MTTSRCWPSGCATERLSPATVPAPRGPVPVGAHCPRAEQRPELDDHRAFIGALAVISTLVIAQVTGLRAYLDARFDGVDRRLDGLDRDVQALTGRFYPDR